MNDPGLIERITRSLAFMLRHQPERFDLEVDAHGFAALDDVVRALNERLGEPVAAEDVEDAVASGDRVRYEIQDDRIRALYGHSIAVEPGAPSKPPEVLYVAIPASELERAQRYGLRGGRRRFLHLAGTLADACEAGRRAARRYAVLSIQALDAWEEGVNFYDRRSLWLAEEVPTHLLEVEEVYEDGTDPVRRPAPRAEGRYGAERSGERERGERGGRRRRGRRGGRGRSEEGEGRLERYDERGPAPERADAWRDEPEEEPVREPAFGRGSFEDDEPDHDDEHVGHEHDHDGDDEDLDRDEEHGADRHAHEDEREDDERDEGGRLDERREPVRAERHGEREPVRGREERGGERLHDRDGGGRRRTRGGRGRGRGRDERERRDERPARGDERPARGDERGPRADERGPSRDDRGPSRDERAPRADDRAPRRDERGPRREERSARGADRGPRRDDRRPRREDGERRGRGEERGPRREEPERRHERPHARDEAREPFGAGMEGNRPLREQSVRPEPPRRAPEPAAERAREPERERERKPENPFGAGL